MTLVSHAHQFVFLKTRKTGGTSFEMLLEPYCAPPDHEIVHHTSGCVSSVGVVGVRVDPRRIAELRRAGTMPRTSFVDSHGVERHVEWFSHTPARRVRAAIGGPAWRAYTRITAVRNPFTRAVSLFFHEIKIGRLQKPGGFPETRDAFRDFVLSNKFETDYEITHIDDKPVFHHAFRLEHKNEDIPRIGAVLGIDLQADQLVHVKNLGRVRRDFPSRDLFDPAVVDAVRTKSAWVFDSFDYPPDIDDASF